MRYTDINEGAIPTADIAEAADRVLYDAFSKIIADAARSLSFSYDYVQEKRDPQYQPEEDAWHRADSLIHWVTQKYWPEQRGSGAYACIYKASDVLTKLVQQTILPTYGADLDQDGKNDGVLVDGQYYPIENIKAHIMHAHGGEIGPEGGLMHRRAPSKDFFVPAGQGREDYTKYAGVSVHIHDTDGFKREYESAVIAQLWITVGQAEDERDMLQQHIDSMVDEIVPTFVHEFDHLLFYLKKPKHTKYSSRTMFANKVSGRAYDNHVDVNDPASFERYLGSDIELQAWASKEAANLVRNRVLAQRRDYSAYRDPDAPISDTRFWNAAIDQLVRDVITRKPYKHHSYIFADMIRDKAESNPIYAKVWRRYLRLLVAKLQSYKK